ncbi:MAG: low molecular weight protein-tyrosine-phosphatase [Verrucomicrobiota bacterium]|nr:low molecular weight protein-tyrosine-phosphatase [Verrucomicrobiota bacterium]
MKRRILFLCMGNICRSPAAHCIFQELVNSAGLSKNYEIDSAGTLHFHEGSPPDSRMQRALRKRNIPIFGQARPIVEEDLSYYDLILAMDSSNLIDAKKLDRDGKFHNKIKLFCDYCTSREEKEVPDPYYGTGDGFEHVLDILQNGCTNLLKLTNSV